MAGIQYKAVKRFSGQRWLSDHVSVDAPWINILVVDEPEMNYHIFLP